MHSAEICHVDGVPRVLTPAMEYPNFKSTGLKKGIRLPLPANIHPHRVRANMWRYVGHDGVVDLAVGADDWTEYGWDNACDATGTWTNGPLQGFVCVLRNWKTTADTDYEPPVKVMAGDRPVEVFGGRRQGSATSTTMGISISSTGSPGEARQVPSSARCHVFSHRDTFRRNPTT